MARGGIRLNKVYAAVDNLTQAMAREAASRVVGTLAAISPYYSGEFADNWAVIPGNVPVSPNTPPTEPRPKTKQTRKEPVLPAIPSLRGTGQNTYTIGNTMEYRDIAMDLVPGRVERAQQISAPQDWYLNYLRSPRGLRQDINSVTDLPVDLESFVVPRSRPFTGPIGRFRR